MGLRHVITGLVVLALAGAGMAVTFVRNKRLLRSGRRVTATVIGKSPGGVVKVPPHTSYGPSLWVGYELDGKHRRSMLWLDQTKETDYEFGQSVDIFLGRGPFRGIRTATDSNLYGRLALNAEMCAAVLGLLLVGWGAFDLVR
jgi:hypothetical protein